MWTLIIIAAIGANTLTIKEVNGFDSKEACVAASVVVETETRGMTHALDLVTVCLEQ